MKPDQDFVLPKCLFGKRDDARRCWRKIARVIWKSERLDEVANIEFARVKPQDFVVFSKWAYETYRDDVPEMWHAYLIGETFEKIVEEADDLAAAIVRFQRIAVAGMEQLWFAAGLLDMQLSYLHMVIPDVQTPTAALLTKFVQWLPQLAQLPLNEWDAERCGWAYNITKLYVNLGIKSAWEPAPTYSEYGNDYLAFLIAKGLVQRSEDGTFAPIINRDRND